MKSETEESYKERILRVLVYIQRHLDETILLQDLAKVSHTSEYHFHRIFRGMVGEPVMGHIRRLRLERAAYFLKFTDQPVTRIAFGAGYETHESFTRAFGSTFGSSPSDFRRAHKSIEFGSAPSGIHYDPNGAIGSFDMQKTDKPGKVELRRIEPIRVAFVRHFGPYQEVGTAWNTLVAWAGNKGLIGQGHVIGVSYDDPLVTPEEKIRYDACIEVDESVHPEGEIGIQELGGGLYAVAIHTGPYEEIGNVYAHICGEWVPERGVELRHIPGLEFYLNSPLDTAPENLRTEVCVPVED